MDPAIRAALAEDVGSGDVTTESAVDARLRARGTLRAKAAGVVSGLDVFARVFLLLDPSARAEPRSRDGDGVAAGDALLAVEAGARALLTGERTALNLVQRMSGVATLTARFVALAAGRARVLDTRKTTPGLRAFEKYAVRCGGGGNHRFGLFDEALIKDNHLDVSGRSLGELIAGLRAAHGALLRITAEARDEAEALAAAAGGADVVLLDNMEPDALAHVCRRVRAASAGAIEIEASGGIDLKSVAAVAASGVDRVSIGALTHSAPALDLSFSVEPLR